MLIISAQTCSTGPGAKQVQHPNSCKAEKAYLRFKVQNPTDHQHKNTLRDEFRRAQKVFDKKYRFF